jgi:hypothetical protein
VKITRFLFVTLAVILVFPCLVLAYGGSGGGTQGQIESGSDSGKICQCETIEEARKGQRWHTRPDAMKKTAYEFLESFPDADRNLMDSYDTGAFTDEEVKDILQWLKDNKMYMSDRALKTLNKLSGTPEGSATKTPKTTSTGKSMETTASAPATKTTSSPSVDKIEQSIKAKKYFIVIMPGSVKNLYKNLKGKYPDKNHFAIQDMLYRKIFTKQERNVIESDLKTHLNIRLLLDQCGQYY